jgi:hypothetical protein
MHRIAVSFVVVSVLLLALPAMAQEAPGRLDKVYSLKPKAGMEQQFVEAAKRHVAWHREHNDPRTWYTFFVEMGDGIGEYHFVLPNQRLEDFDTYDELAQADEADAFATMGPYVESVAAQMGVRLDNLSRISAGVGPGALNWVTYVHINPGMVGSYRLYRQKLQAAHEKTNSRQRYFVVQVINGSEIPAFAVVAPVQKWAEFGPPRTRQVLTEAYGPAEAEQLLKLRNRATHCAKSFISRYRPDLSYIPEGQ